MLSDVVKEWGGIEVSPMDLYRDMFKLGEGYIQKENEEPGEYKTNPIGYWKNDKDSKGQYRILFEDTFEEVLVELQQADFSILNGVTYFGRKNLMANASKMFAMIFDLDGITEKTLANFFSGSMRAGAYPVPNYVVLSGHGVHLYYLFEEPISLYPNIKLQLKELKYALTRKIWNHYTSTIEKPQYQGINQGFRVVGGSTKISGVDVRAFRVNTHPFSLFQLCEYVPKEFRVDDKKLWKESSMTLAQAKKKYPEWFERRVVQGKPKGTWTCKRDLYDWWLRELKDGASVGHRYFCVMCLAIFGVKSGISYEEVRRDAYELLSFLDGMSNTDPFTKQDCDSALECYDERYFTFPTKDISNLSGIEIIPNKRNGRKRADHVKLMNFIRDEINNNKNWRNTDGRPVGSGTLERVVKEYRIAHPEARKADCIRDTGLSKPTVYKWWNS